MFTCLHVYNQVYTYFCLHNQAQNKIYLQICLFVRLSAYAHVHMFTCPFKLDTISYMLGKDRIMQNSLYWQAVLSQQRLLRYVQRIRRDLWHTNFVWPSCTAIQVKCTPVSVHLNCTTGRQPGLSVYCRSCRQPGTQILILSFHLGSGYLTEQYRQVRNYMTVQ